MNVISFVARFVMIVWRAVRCDLNRIASEMDGDDFIAMFKQYLLFLSFTSCICFCLKYGWR